jgi:hypothetical protein
MGSKEMIYEFRMFTKNNEKKNRIGKNMGNNEDE